MVNFLLKFQKVFVNFLQKPKSPGSFVFIVQNNFQVTTKKMFEIKHNHCGP